MSHLNVTTMMAQLDQIPESRDRVDLMCKYALSSGFPVDQFLMEVGALLTDFDRQRANNIDLEEELDRLHRDIVNMQTRINELNQQLTAHPPDVQPPKAASN
jgi:hypothetical protein